ncbi:hypothetical protein CH304_15265 [Rhodococcus sp. 15-649-1-2]|nr:MULTISPECIES: hypothetical protein [unclassified Rhodococcus (in: high G+C Gram-positive bacteria)]OZE82387.1 hypothetical protein CH304_15265 [Rhodococcus sp. 15-649-1-2]OZF04673.1 hypothetical protein CH300_14860 [Rhodococcus sp. 15-1154-1]
MRSAVEVLGAVLLFAAAVVCWNLGATEHLFAATDEGAPEFVAVRYSGSWTAAGAACVTVAFLLLVDAVRVRFQRRSHTR